MPRFAARGLSDELEKHFAGTPSTRVQAALRLGEHAIDLFLTSLPRGTTRQRARTLMQRNRHPGRRRSKVAGASDA